MHLTAVVLFSILGMGFCSWVPERSEGIEELHKNLVDDHRAIEQLETFIEKEKQEGTGSRTWKALKKFFSPVRNWFAELPSKTPVEVSNEAKSSTRSFFAWLKGTPVYKAASSSLRPVKEWLVNKSNEVNGKTFRQIYHDAKTNVKRVDDKVGNWLDSKIASE